MSDQAVLRRTDHKSALALLFSLTPLYALVQTRSKLGFRLDNLHLGLIQVVLLLVLRYILGYDPRPGHQVETRVVANGVDQDDDQHQVTVGGAAKTKQRRRVRKAKKEPGLFPLSLLDSNVYSFLSVTAPSYLSKVPNKPSDQELAKLPKQAALEEWTTLHESDNIRVRQHPTAKALYAIEASFDDVPLRNLFETLVSIEARPEWDKMCQGTEHIEERIEIAGRKASVSWLGMKGMAVVKPKDMCLLSVGGRLSSESKEAEEPLRLFVATRSFDHPKCPPKPGFNRMSLSISGFIAEQHGEKGSKVIQITDLSGLGSWVPSAVFNTVTQTMIPKSLFRLGRTAAARDIATHSKFPVDSNEWMPPYLEEFKAEADGEDGEEEEVDDDDDEVIDEGDELSPSQSRELHGLVSQLRSLTSRLSALESKTTGTGVSGRIFRMLGIEGDSASSTALTAAASAVSAAAAVAALRAWNNRKK